MYIIQYIYFGKCFNPFKKKRYTRDQMFILNKQMTDETNKSFSEFSASRRTLRRQQWTEELKTFSLKRVIKVSTNCKGSGWNIRIHPQSQGWLGYKDHSRPCNALKIPVTVLPHTCPWGPSLEGKLLRAFESKALLYITGQSVGRDTLSISPKQQNSLNWHNFPSIL